VAHGNLALVAALTVQDIAVEAERVIAKPDGVVSVVVDGVAAEVNVELVVAEEEQDEVASARVEQRGLPLRHPLRQEERPEFCSALFQKSVFTIAIYPSELGRHVAHLLFGLRFSSGFTACRHGFLDSRTGSDASWPHSDRICSTVSAF
jgi:hypothetical protein